MDLLPEVKAKERLGAGYDETADNVIATSETDPIQDWLDNNRCHWVIPWLGDRAADELTTDQRLFILSELKKEENTL